MTIPQNSCPIVASFDPEIDAYCTTCGYNLRGTHGSACPECGTGFMLGAPRQLEHYGLYLAALIATAGEAFISQYSLYVIIHALTDPGTLFMIYGAFEVFTYVFNVLAIPYLVLLIIFRKRIVRASTGMRLGWAIPPIVFAVLEVGYTMYNVILY